MATNPIQTPLPADLPENWTYGQTVGPNGTDVGLTTQHGYNYLMEQVNSSQECINLLGDSFSSLASLDSTGKLPASQIPALPYDPAGAAQVVIRDATITSGLIILTDASNIDSGSIIKVYAPSNSQSVTQGISIDNTAYPIFDSNGETINGEADIWTEGAALSLLIDKQNEVAYLLNSISPGGFIESTQSIPTAQRSSNALYGLILADFGGGN